MGFTNTDNNIIMIKLKFKFQRETFSNFKCLLYCPLQNNAHNVH